MSRFATFRYFLILVALWALFFATIKFFLWSDLSTTLAPDLQMIAGYLSIGSAIAFLIGGALAQTFLKKYYLFAVAIFSALFVSFGYLFGYRSDIVFAFMVSLLGLLYGLWNVMKSVLVSVEIERTGMRETAVTAIVGMLFVICIIIGSWLGSFLYERMGHGGYVVIIVFLITAAGISLFLDYDTITFHSLLKNGWRSYFSQKRNTFLSSMRSYVPDMQHILKNYLPIIITSSIFWSVSTIVSQASVEYSATTFGMKNSAATMILLYSAIGAIVGSFLSIRMNTRRWFFFLVFTLLFALCVFLIPILGKTFAMLSVLATILGVCFGTAVNLSDSYLLKRYGEDNKKEYGSSTQGLIFSIILFLSMFFSSKGLALWGYNTLMYILSGIVCVVGVILYIIERSKEK